jgi:hypothetical protein
MDTREFLLNIHYRLAGLRQARELYAVKLAPDFNLTPLACFGRTRGGCRGFLRTFSTPKVPMPKGWCFWNHS